MTELEKAIVRDAAQNILKAVSDVVMPTTTLCLVIHETTRLKLCTYDAHDIFERTNDAQDLPF